MSGIKFGSVAEKREPSALLLKFFDVCSMFYNLSFPLIVEDRVCYVSDIFTGDEPDISKAFVAYDEGDKIVISFARMWLGPYGETLYSMTVVLQCYSVVRAAESFRLFATGLNGPFGD